ncbi:RNA polymerase sigma factor [Pseudofulvibacter geojedonensis]|uniref:RNA polymerase sigma factor n=1 Tax=Pseudofulvibacter geojedonensis TaxID=1123758 RepID=A0ABW3HYY6_9FLAO
MFQIDIIEKCKQNNRKAQLKLYNQYCNGMYIVAYRFVKNETEAEDIVQEAFINAFSKLEQYNAQVSFGSWLKRIVINKSIDFIKTKKAQFIDLNESSLTIANKPDENEWLVDESVTYHQAIEAINALPDKYKYVLMLYLIEGYDHQEIAQILKISEAASRTQLSRGKQKLQKKLTPIRHVARS